MKIKTVRDLYNSLPGNAAYACLGKFYYKWSSDSVPEEEKSLCMDLEDKLNDLGYTYIDKDIPIGYYNDIQGYFNCDIEEL